MSEISTGLRIRGFEVWATEPHHYRHYHTLFLRVPGTFPTEVYEERLRDGSTTGRWVIGFTRPDGRKQATYRSFDTRDEAERARTTFRGATEAALACQFEAALRQGKPWGATWANPRLDYAPLRFDLTEDDASAVIAWREQADAAWFAAYPEFLPREQRITEAQVAGMSPAAAEFYVDAKAAFGNEAVAVPGACLPAETECLECGAVYGEVGHVQAGGMSCDRCAPRYRRQARRR